MPHRSANFRLSDANQHRRAISELLDLIAASVLVRRHVVRRQQPVFQPGDAFSNLFVISSGSFRVMTAAQDGREQIVGLKFRGDWLGFDAIAERKHGSGAVAMDESEVWAIPYSLLGEACIQAPPLMAAVLEAMSLELLHDRNTMIILRALPATARVADFLRTWAFAQACRGLPTDRIRLPMSRAEIANYLGISVETVSRALSRLSHAGLISFSDVARRDLLIENVRALGTFVQECLSAP